MHNLPEQLAKLAYLIRTHGSCNKAKVLAVIDNVNNIHFSIDADLGTENKEQDPDKVAELIIGHFDTFIADPSPNWEMEAVIEFNAEGFQERAEIKRRKRKTREFSYEITSQVDTTAKKWKLPLPAEGLLVSGFTLNGQRVNAWKPAIVDNSNPGIWFGNTDFNGTVLYNEVTGEVSLQRLSFSKGVQLLVHFRGDLNQPVTI